MPLAQPIDKALNAFAEAQEGARRFHAEAIGKDIDARYCFGDFLQSIRSNNVKRLTGVYKTALSETASGTTGGYLVPVELRQDILADVAEQSIFRPRATVVPMNSLTLSLPVMDATTVPSAAGVAPFWGGLYMQWGEETATRPETEPKLRQLQLVANNLGGYALVSNPMMADMKGTEKWLRTVFARSLGWYEDWSFISGNGVNQPQGVISAPGTIAITRNTSSHFKAADGQAMMASFYSPSGTITGCWLASQTVGADITGQTGWIPNGMYQMYGMPIYDTAKQPPLGTKGDVLLIDASLYVIGDREELTIAYSKEYQAAFLKQQTAWFIQERIDGQPLLNAAITLPDGVGTNTVSPFVVLN